MSVPAIVLTGASGQLGRTLQDQWPDSTLASKFDLIAFDRNQLDITKESDLEKNLAGLDVHALINTAAYTAVDQAEEATQEEKAFEINELGAANVARWTSARNAKLIHISTDFVFSGDSQTAYQPQDSASPQGAYGRSKLAGEHAIASIAADNSVIIRTSWLYSYHGRNFLKTMLKLMNERDELNVVNDQIGSPTSCIGLSRVLIKALEKNMPAGIYHWCDDGAISWYDFAVAIQQEGLSRGILKREIPVNPISTEEYPTPAKRPAFSVLNTELTKGALGIHANDWRAELGTVLEKI